VRTAIRKHRGDFGAIIGLLVIAAVVGGYILHNQRLRFPFIQPKPFHVNVELDTAQAVQAGQGQTVRVAGVRIGDIGKVSLRDGIAVVRLDVDQKYRKLIRRDASALLRSKTGLKDMFIELDPGNGAEIPSNGTIPLANTSPDVNPDEFLATLDTDTRQYVQLLIGGAGEGLKGHGSELRNALERLGPTHRDLARLSGALVTRRANLRHLIHTYGQLTSDLGQNGTQLTSLVRNANAVLESTAAEDTSLASTINKLPASLRATSSALSKTGRFADVLGPTLQALRPAVRQLPATNAAVIPLAREGTPILRDKVRPFARALPGLLSHLGPASMNLTKAAPDLTKSFLELNRLFDIGAYNPKGAESLSGKSLSEQRARQEGFLYWLGWTAQDGNSVFSTANADGPVRRVAFQGLDCGTITAGLPAALAPIGSLLAPVLQTAGVCIK
jgi:phospholipid/cholesterol/gamma-HCH transport system substrate-binding protein